MQLTSCWRVAGRFIFKTMRAIYCSYIFYFMPYSVLFIPYMASASSAAD